MNYAIVITTDGRAGLLERMLESFNTRVRPRPNVALVVDDSGDLQYKRFLNDLLPRYFRRWELVTHPKRLGFCATVADAWKLAAERIDIQWVWWAEDDFVYTRMIDLDLFAFVLQKERQVGQMALMRNPVSPEEIAAGSFIQMRPGSYHRRGEGGMKWLEHAVNWTTNPSLFRRRFAVENPWPLTPECEGRFGFQVREANPATTFGIWGSGDPWCMHAGERAGNGY